MIDGKKVLAIVPARGGSKGVPRKNIKALLGKPLIGWTFDAARSCKYIDRLVLSTEDEEIAEVARRLGCDVPFIRAQHLAHDSTPGIDPVLDALQRLPGFDYVVLLQPTSPLRTSRHIDEALELCVGSGSPACVSMCAVSEHPAWMFTRDDSGRVLSFAGTGPMPARRQDLKELYIPNGAVYVAQTDWLQGSRSFFSDETVTTIMPVSASVDIDTPVDFLLAESILRSEQR